MNMNEAIKSYFEREDIRKQSIADLAEILSIPSIAGEPDGIYPYGKVCAEALDVAEKLGKKYGFKVENHEYHCMSILFGEEEQEIGIVCHLDVVPAGDGWSVPPYALTEKDGLLMGRGTHDDKGPFIQSLYTLRFFKENNVKLPFTVRLILGSDEEVGSSDLEYFVTVRKPPMFSFTPDSDFPVCIGEKGILSVAVDLPGVDKGIKTVCGGTVTNAVAGSAYAIVETDKTLESKNGIAVEKVDDGIKITATGKASHAARPELGVSAINMLVNYLLENDLCSKDGIFGLIADSTAEYKGETLGIAAENEAFGYLTCVGGVINGNSEKTVMHYNIRYLPETPYQEIVASIENAVKPYGGIVNIGSQSDGYFVSADDKKIKALTDACESVLGFECKPYTMGGGTYARWLANTVAFGSGVEGERKFLGDERGGAHQRDEYISVKEFFQGMEIYSRALSNLSEIL